MSQSPPSLCPVCRNEKTVLSLPGLYDDRYGFSGEFDMRACPKCGHQFLEASFSADRLQRLYTEYYPRSTLSLAEWSPHREHGFFRLWVGRGGSAVFRWVPRNVKVLDIGCGFGESLGYHLARGCEVQGVEADENVLRVAERFGFDVRVGVFSAADFPHNHFDFVTLDQVIEHVADPVSVLRDVRLVLRPGGTLLLSTPNGRSLTARLLGRHWVHCHPPYHLQLFSRESLVAAAEAADFRIVWLRNITHPRWYGFQWLHLLALPNPGEPSIFWTQGAMWPRRRWLARKLLSGLGRIGVNHAISLLLDSLSQGDNLVAKLEKKRE